MIQGRRARRNGWQERALGALLLVAVASACHVSPPTPEAVLAYGFHTPEQAFASFQTALRMDDPTLELRCFSSDFRARNHASSLTWRVAREELAREQPWLRTGVVRAEIVGSRVLGDRAVLRLRTAGRAFEIALVREDFVEAWSGPERVIDEPADWSSSTGIQEGASGGRWIFGRAALPAGVDAAAIDELRVGREWKIDDARAVDDDAPGSRPRRAPPSDDAL